MRLSDWLPAISAVIGRAPPVNQTLTLEPRAESELCCQHSQSQSLHFAAAEISIQERDGDIKADNIFGYKISETQYLELRLGAGEVW